MKDVAGILPSGQRTGSVAARCEAAGRLAELLRPETELPRRSPGQAGAFS